MSCVNYASKYIDTNAWSKTAPLKEYAPVDAILPFSARSDVYPAADESPAAGNG